MTEKIRIANFKSLLTSPFRKVSQLSNIEYQESEDPASALSAFKADLALIPTRKFFQEGHFEALPYGLIRGQLPFYLWCYRPGAIDFDTLGCVEKMFDVGLEEREVFLREAAEEAQRCKESLLRRCINTYSYRLTESCKHNLNSLIASSSTLPSTPLAGKSRLSKSPLTDSITISTSIETLSQQKRLSSFQASKLHDSARTEELVLATRSGKVKSNYRGEISFKSDAAFARALEHKDLVSEDQRELLYEYSQRDITELSIQGVGSFPMIQLIGMLKTAQDEIPNCFLALEDIVDIASRESKSLEDCLRSLREFGLRYLSCQASSEQAIILASSLGFSLACEISFEKPVFSSFLRELQDRRSCFYALELQPPWEESAELAFEQPELEEITRVTAVCNQFYDNFPPVTLIVPNIESRFIPLLAEFGVKNVLEEIPIEESIGNKLEGVWRRKVNSIKRAELKAKAS